MFNPLGKRSKVGGERKALVAEASLYPTGAGALTNFKFISIPHLSDGSRKWWGWCVYNGRQLSRNGESQSFEKSAAIPPLLGLKARYVMPWADA